MNQCLTGGVITSVNPIGVSRFQDTLDRAIFLGRCNPAPMQSAQC
jgi:hypothetical protein